MARPFKRPPSPQGVRSSTVMSTQKSPARQAPAVLASLVQSKGDPAAHSSMATFTEYLLSRLRNFLRSLRIGYFGLHIDSNESDGLALGAVL
eukprot:scaffold1701_cov245-Pinguiococcus_pyrenoidosus.AAC.2